MTTIQRPLKWHGGKHYLAKRIVSLMPKHTHYVEPYFGGGAVLFAKPMGCSEVINDLNEGLINFWRVLRDPDSFTQLQELVQKTPFSEQEFLQAKDWSERPIKPPDVAAAWAFFVQYRQSRQGLGKCFATLTKNRTRRGVNEQAASWLSAIEGLSDAHLRLRSVVILKKPALKVIQQEDGPNTLFYLDPPYLHETRVTTKDYAHEMSLFDHQSLLSALECLQGKFILSGYRSELYDSVARQQKWRRVDVEIDNKASSKSVKEKKTECLWMNY